MSKLISLINLKVNKKSVVKKVDDFDQKFKCRLIELGFVNGEKVVVLKNFKNNKTLLVLVRGSVFALDYNLAEKIFVYEV